MLLIKNGTIVTMNEARDIIQGDLLIENDRVASIGGTVDDHEITVIDAARKLVIPGLIQTHTHLCQALFRGLADDLELLDWLKLRIWPLEGSHDAESIYHSALLGCAELLRGGTTSIIDMATVHHTDSLLEAVQLAGIRYLGGKCLMDCGSDVPSSLLESPAQALQESMDLWQDWNGAADSRIHYAFCPRFAVSCSNGLLRELAALSRQYGIPVHSHASENRGEIAMVEQERGQRNIMYLNSLGLLNSRTVLAHCIHLNEEEMKVLVGTGTNIAHCPGSNLKLGSGIARVPDLLAMGAHISLGADGAPCNNNMSMFMEMRLAALIQKPLHGPASMPAQQVFELATRGGARAMGLEADIGSLEPGKKADLALVDLEGWHHQPRDAASVYSHLVYQATAQDIAVTIVDGKVLWQDSRLTQINEEVLKNDTATSLGRVLTRAGLA
ncbi:MAG: 5'-deoxyadenosine deaminase [Deltaproteobacteria bacterium]